MNERKTVFLKGMQEKHEEQIKQKQKIKKKKTLKKWLKEIFYFSFFRNVIDVIIYILAIIGTATLIYPETRALMVKMIQELLNYFNLFI